MGEEFKNHNSTIGMKVKETINRMKQSGFFNIIFSSTLSKVVSLCSGMLIVRVLSKNDYGIYGYVLNFVSILMIVNGLGTMTAMLQFGCDSSADLNKRNSYFKYGFRIGIVFNSILSLALLLYGIFGKEEIPNSSFCICLAALLPMFQFVSESISTYFRAENENKKYSRYNNVFSILHLVCLVGFSFLYGVQGALTSKYISYVLAFLYALHLGRELRLVFRKESNTLTHEEKQSFIRFSLTSCCNNSISQLFHNVDLFLIGILLASTTEIANYKAATTIPLALTFISSAVVVYIYPKFVKNKNNIRWLQRNYLKVFLGLGTFNLAITIFLCMAAPFVVPFVFGAEYVDAIPLFRILMIGFFFSATFRVLAGNVLDMLYLIKPNLIISIACGVLNVLLDYVLIERMGSIGAAIATSAIYLLYGLLSNFVLFVHLKRIKKSAE